MSKEVPSLEPGFMGSPAAQMHLACVLRILALLREAGFSEQEAARFLIGCGAGHASELGLSLEDCLACAESAWRAYHAMTDELREEILAAARESL